MLSINKEKLKSYSYNLQKPNVIFNEYGNLTTRFLWPLFNECFHEELIKLEHNFFVQCYYTDEDYNIPYNNKPYIFLLLRKPTNNKIYKRLHNILIKSPNFVKFYYKGLLDNKDHSYVYILECNNNFVNDYNIVINGKYSKLSEISKKRILKFNERKNLSINKPEQVYKTIHSVLYKTNYAKNTIENILAVKLDPEQEFWTEYNIDNETLKKQ